MLQFILTAIFEAWLFLVAYLLARHAIGAGARARQLAILLAESNVKSAEAAQRASEAAQTLAKIIEEKQHAE